MCCWKHVSAKIIFSGKPFIFYFLISEYFYIKTFCWKIKITYIQKVQHNGLVNIYICPPIATVKLSNFHHHP
jgi:hypothetical protein